MSRPTFGYPRLANSNGINYSDVAGGLRAGGYATGAKLAAIEYNELHNEIDQWIEWLDSITRLDTGVLAYPTYYGIYGDLGLASGSVGLTGATGTVSIKSGKYALTGYNVHLDIVIQLTGLSGTLTDVRITLPATSIAWNGGVLNCLAYCMSRYTGNDGQCFIANNTNAVGEEGCPCTAGFDATNILHLWRSNFGTGSPIPFQVDGGNTKFSVSIDYEQLH